jgi:hypothetical protein
MAHIDWLTFFHPQPLVLHSPHQKSTSMLSQHPGETPRVVDLVIHRTPIGIKKAQRNVAHRATRM